jgi:hypothetical protein
LADPSFYANYDENDATADMLLLIQIERQVHRAHEKSLTPRTSNGGAPELDSRLADSILLQVARLKVTSISNTDQGAVLQKQLLEYVSALRDGERYKEQGERHYEETVASIDSVEKQIHFATIFARYMRLIEPAEVPRRQRMIGP